jgi:hypothetical protein
MTSRSSLPDKERGEERCFFIATDDATKLRRRRTARREAVATCDALNTSFASAGLPSPPFSSLHFNASHVTILCACGRGVMS